MVVGSHDSSVQRGEDCSAGVVDGDRHDVHEDGKDEDIYDDDDDDDDDDEFCVGSAVFKLVLVRCTERNMKSEYEVRGQG